MKNFTCLLLGGLCVAGALAAVAEDQLTLFEFNTEPEIKTVVTDLKDSKDKLKSFSLAVPPTAGKSFAAEFELDLKTFNHYAQLHLGLGNGKNQKLQLVFSMGDDRVPRCAFVAQTVAGLGARIKPFEPVPLGKLRLSIDYSSARRTVRFLIRNQEGKTLYDSGAVKISGKFNLDRFVVGVAENADEAGEISYDADAGALFCRSYVGVEGEYPYAIEGSLDNIAVRRESDGK